ncbi:hypothetical protein PDN02_16340 [Bacillus cereus]|nr:hypothetical protein [Bacillus cereus]MDA2076667.1 hypothetical protein [Bacillus cereus]MDA2081377.1 hypothetical protein [Bacillus cereus]
MQAKESKEYIDNIVQEVQKKAITHEKALESLTKHYLMLIQTVDSQNIQLFKEESDESDLDYAKRLANMRILESYLFNN